MFNENINKKVAIDFLNSEIKEITERWVSFTINVRAFDSHFRDKDLTVFPDEKVKRFKELQRRLLKIQDKQARLKVLKKIDKQEHKEFKEWQDNYTKERARDRSLKGAHECEEFLEVANLFLKDLKAKK